jgi:hypothetical protein
LLELAKPKEDVVFIISTDDTAVIAVVRQKQYAAAVGKGRGNRGVKVVAEWRNATELMAEVGEGRIPIPITIPTSTSLNSLKAAVVR